MDRHFSSSFKSEPPISTILLSRLLCNVYIGIAGNLNEGQIMKYFQFVSNFHYIRCTSFSWIINGSSDDNFPIGDRSIVSIVIRVEINCGDSPLCDPRVKFDWGRAKKITGKVLIKRGRGFPRATKNSSRSSHLLQFSQGWKKERTSGEGMIGYRRSLRRCRKLGSALRFS